MGVFVYLFIKQSQVNFRLASKRLLSPHVYCVGVCVRNITCNYGRNWLGGNYRISSCKCCRERLVYI